jgi:hypothetical protein
LSGNQSQSKSGKNSNSVESRNKYLEEVNRDIGSINRVEIEIRRLNNGTKCDFRETNWDRREYSNARTATNEYDKIMVELELQKEELRKAQDFVTNYRLK